MKKVLVLLAVFVGSTLAHAERNYFGIEGGWASVDSSAADDAQLLANAIGQTVNVTYDKGAVVGRVFVGFPLDDKLAIEVGAFQTGDVTEKYTWNGGSVNANASASGFDLSAIVKPADEGIFFKIGMHSSKINAQAALTVSGFGSINLGNSPSGTGFLAGVGFEGKLDETSALRFGYTYYNKIGGEADADTSMVTASYLKRFD